VNEITKIGTKFAKGQAYFKALYDKGELIPCSPGLLPGACGDGHKYLKSVHCGREYCPDCGRDGSPTHGRRFNRWMPKVRDMRYLGYLVITVPEELKQDFHSKQVLSSFRMLLRRKLVKMGYKRGLMRWHYFGDCQSCKGEGCRLCHQTGAGKKWNPHLNVLLDQGFIENFKDSEFRTDLNRWLNLFFKRMNGGKSCKVNFHFSYQEDDLQKINVVKYVTRSTFRHYNRATAFMLYRFTSTSSWGKFDTEITTEEALDNGCCPHCKSKGKHSSVHWMKLNCQDNYANTKIIHLKNGNYHVIESKKNNGRNLAFDSIGARIKRRARPKIERAYRLPGYHTTNIKKCSY
jgi:ribosomal protein S8